MHEIVKMDAKPMNNGTSPVPPLKTKKYSCFSILSLSRHGFNQQNPTQPNTTYKFCWLLGTQQPTNAQLVLGTQQPTSIISKVGVVYPTPTTVGQCWVPNFFLKKIQHEKRIISASRVFSCPKNKPVMADFKFFKQVQQIIISTIFEIFDLKLGKMLHNPTVVCPTTNLTNC